MRTLLLALLGTMTVSAPSPAESAAPERTCVRVRSVGSLPLKVQVGGETVKFYEWVAKDVNSSEFIGFKAQASSHVSFAVRSGNETFETRNTQWMHPRGVVGGRVKGINSIEVCR